MAKPQSLARIKTESPIAHFEHVDLYCPSFGCADGYGKSAERLAMGLEAKGSKVQLVGLTRPMGQITAESIWNRRQAPRGDAIIFYGLPQMWHPQQRKAIGFTMYESDALPLAWRTSLNAMDEIVVPSSWLVPIFSEFTTTPVKLVPLGVDVEELSPRLRVRGEKLNFLHFSTSDEFRKGTDIAVAAFEAAFPAGRTDVSLTLRSTLPAPQRQVGSRVRYAGGLLTPEQLRDYYHQFDCLLHTSRSEGFGMVPLEAMASGMPAIFGNATGMADYAEFGMSVPTHATSAANIGVGRPQLIAADGTFGRWQEPNFDALVDTLRAFDANYGIVTEQAFENTKKIASQWSWERSANALYRRLGS